MTTPNNEALSVATAVAGYAPRHIEANDHGSDEMPSPPHGGDEHTDTCDCCNEPAYTCIDVTVGKYSIRSFESFWLSQSVSKHHRFELVIAHDALISENGRPLVEDQWMTNACKLLGECISIGFHYHTSPDKKRYFEGIITNVGYRRNTCGFGDIVITGGSPTLLLDCAPHIQSFTGRNLKDIATKVIDDGGVSTRGVAPCVFTKPLQYSCQYHETHYNYLARLSTCYGEWFFYDGEDLHFGKPAPKPKVKLVLGCDVSDLQGQVNGCHVMPVHYGYNSRANEHLTAHSYEISGIEELGMTALNISQRMYQTPSIQVAPVRTELDEDVTITQKGAAAAAAVELFTVEGVTSNPHLFPGCYVELGVRCVTTHAISHYADIIIVEMHQTMDHCGQYSCTFKGISAKTACLPPPHFIRPVAGPEIGVVTCNDDCHGRVKVKFPWQECPTDHIRVMAPDAGCSDNVHHNRGWVTIPEVGDQVVCGFLHHNPDRPFVMGGLFHGKCGCGGGKDNHNRCYTTPCGHKLHFDECGGITIIDKTTLNSILIDGIGTITILAAAGILLSNGLSALSMVGDNVSINAGTVCINGSELVSMGSGAAGFCATSECDKAEVTGCETNIVGTSRTCLTGPDTTISGDTVAVNATADAAINGGLVKINS